MNRLLDDGANFTISTSGIFYAPVSETGHGGFLSDIRGEGITEELKVLTYDSSDYPGYAYIKIYNKNASKANMITYLKEMLHLEKTVTFGSTPGRYDNIIEIG